MIDLNKLPDENEWQYTWRVGQAKDSGIIDNTWDELGTIFNSECREDGDEKSSSRWRKAYQDAKGYWDNCFSKMISKESLSKINEQRQEIYKETIRLRDERNALNKKLRTESRLEHRLIKIEEIFKEPYDVNFESNVITDTSGDNDLIVCLSDLHIGECFDNRFGKYDVDIAKRRLQEYLYKINVIQSRHKSKNCHVILMGDLISGSIHRTIQVENAENVIEQIKICSVLIKEFVKAMKDSFEEIYISSVNGNHSRMAKKEESIKDERLDELIPWYLETALYKYKNIHIRKEKIDSTIDEFEIYGKKYLNVHGDYDKMNMQGISKLSTMVGYRPYAVFFGHYHTCTIDNAYGVKMIRSGSLSGSGNSYTIEKRLSGIASQMVCVCDTNGISTYYPIEFI